MNPGNIKLLVTVILVLLVLYFVLRARTERIKRRRDDHHSRFRKNR